MKVLIGCESSGQIRRAFTARGHEAWSCDLLPSSDNSPLHIQCDIRVFLKYMRGYFDLFIVHPDCTYLSVSGLHWNKRRPERAALTEQALRFAIEMAETDIPKVVMENPIGCISTRYRKSDQIIQPYNFGHDASKATCLWLKGLPLLKNTAFFKPRMVCKRCKSRSTYDDAFGKGCPTCGAEAGLLLPRWGNQTDSGQNNLLPSDDRWQIRAETYSGIADAMADQWGQI